MSRLLARRAQIQQQLEQEGILSAPLSAPIRQRESDREIPLSYAQQRLWIAEQLGEGQALYNIPAAISISGDLRIDLLEKTFYELTARHEAMRTLIASSKDGQPVQRISPVQPYHLDVRDLRGQVEGDREARIRHEFDVEAHLPFDTEHDLLFRTVLLQLDEQEFALLFTMHHIISDRWSIGILVREIAAIYKALLLDESPSLPDVPIQYADFSIWQRDWMQGEVQAQQLSFWKKQLSGAPTALELPTDFPRPDFLTYEGKTKPIQLAKELTTSLQEWSLRENATLFMALLTGYHLLLSYFSKQRDIVTGSPIAGRNRIELENIVGFFINTMALRSRLRDDMTLTELIGQVRDFTLGAYANQDLPFDLVIEKVAPERSLNRTPLFQTWFNFQNTPMSELMLPNLKLSLLEYELGIVKFDLSLDLRESDGVVTGGLSYNTALFKPATIDTFAECLNYLLHQIVQVPERTVADLFKSLDEWQRERDLAEQQTFKKSRSSKLKSVKAKTIHSAE